MLGRHEHRDELVADRRAQSRVTFVDRSKKARIRMGIDYPSAPAELRVAIEEFWPESEWENAAAVARLESGWDAFAVLDSTDAAHPCGSFIGERDGVRITAERSVGYFQLNSCNFPDWEWQRFYNARHNAGTAHQLWDERGGSWSPWYFSAKTLGLS